MRKCKGRRGKKFNETNETLMISGKQNKKNAKIILKLNKQRIKIKRERKKTINKLTYDLKKI